MHLQRKLHQKILSYTKLYDLYLLMNAKTNSEAATTCDTQPSATNNVNQSSEKKSAVISFMTAEYNSLRNKINQYKSGQITLFSATASATGIMLGLFVSLMLNQTSNLFICSILILLPLMVILPSSWMYFDNAIKINRLEAYCTTYAKNFIYSASKQYQYLGYSEYKRRYLESLASHVSISSSGADNEERIGFVAKIKDTITYWIFKEDFGYWRNSFYAYFGLELICILVFGVFFMSNQNSEIYISLELEQIATYCEMLFSVLMFVTIFSLKTFWNFFRGPRRYSKEYSYHIISLFLFWLGVIALLRYYQIFLGFILILCALLGFTYVKVFLRPNSCGSVLEEPYKERILFLCYIFSIVVIYGIGVLLPFISKQIPLIHCFTIFFITIFLLSSAWKFVIVSSILFGKNSYYRAMYRWEFIIKNMMTTSDDGSIKNTCDVDQPN